MTELAKPENEPMMLFFKYCVMQTTAWGKPEELFDQATQKLKADATWLQNGTEPRDGQPDPRPKKHIQKEISKKHPKYLTVCQTIAHETDEYDELFNESGQRSS